MNKIVKIISNIEKDNFTKYVKKVLVNLMVEYFNIKFLRNLPKISIF